MLLESMFLTIAGASAIAVPVGIGFWGSFGIGALVAIIFALVGLATWWVYNKLTENNKEKSSTKDKPTHELDEPQRNRTKEEPEITKETERKNEHVAKDNTSRDKSDGPNVNEQDGLGVFSDDTSEIGSYGGSRSTSEKGSSVNEQSMLEENSEYTSETGSSEYTSETGSYEESKSEKDSSEFSRSTEQSRRRSGNDLSRINSDGSINVQPEVVAPIAQSGRETPMKGGKRVSFPQMEVKKTEDHIVSNSESEDDFIALNVSNPVEILKDSSESELSIPIEQNRRTDVKEETRREQLQDGELNRLGVPSLSQQDEVQSEGATIPVQFRKEEIRGPFSQEVKSPEDHIVNNSESEDDFIALRNEIFKDIKQKISEEKNKIEENAIMLIRKVGINAKEGVSDNVKDLVGSLGQNYKDKAEVALLNLNTTDDDIFYKHKEKYNIIEDEELANIVAKEDVAKATRLKAIADNDNKSIYEHIYNYFKAKREYAFLIMKKEILRKQMKQIEEESANNQDKTFENDLKIIIENICCVNLPTMEGSLEDVSKGEAEQCSSIIKAINEIKDKELKIEAAKIFRKFKEELKAIYEGEEVYDEAAAQIEQTKIDEFIFNIYNNINEAKITYLEKRCQKLKNDIANNNDTIDKHGREILRKVKHHEEENQYKETKLQYSDPMTVLAKYLKDEYKLDNDEKLQSDENVYVPFNKCLNAFRKQALNEMKLTILQSFLDMKDEFSEEDFEKDFKVIKGINGVKTPEAISTESLNKEILDNLQSKSIENVLGGLSVITSHLNDLIDSIQNSKFKYIAKEAFNKYIGKLGKIANVCIPIYTDRMNQLQKLEEFSAHDEINNNNLSHESDNRNIPYDGDYDDTNDIDSVNNAAIQEAIISREKDLIKFIQEEEVDLEPIDDLMEEKFSEISSSLMTNRGVINDIKSSSISSDSQVEKENFPDSDECIFDFNDKSVADNNIVEDNLLSASLDSSSEYLNHNSNLGEDNGVINSRVLPNRRDDFSLSDSKNGSAQESNYIVGNGLSYEYSEYSEYYRGDKIDNGGSGDDSSIRQVNTALKNDNDPKIIDDINSELEDAEKNNILSEDYLNAFEGNLELIRDEEDDLELIHSVNGHVLDTAIDDLSMFSFGVEEGEEGFLDDQLLNIGTNVNEYSVGQKRKNEIDKSSSDLNQTGGLKKVSNVVSRNHSSFSSSSLMDVINSYKKEEISRRNSPNNSINNKRHDEQEIT